MKPAGHRTGQRGEDEAAAYLRRQGMRLLARNWRHGQLELDMVCQEGHTVIFVEVKTRKADGLGTPMDAITTRKKAALIKAAQHWLREHEAWDAPCRFDVVAVFVHGEHCTLEHYRHAFDFSTPMGGSNTAWQPW